MDKHNLESLNGAWDFCVWDGERPPETIPDGLAWQSGKYQVEAAPGGGGLAPLGLARRKLRVEERAGMRAWLRFERCGGPAVFYLNGRRFYVSSESWLAVEMDIQDHAVLSTGPEGAQGENELVVWRGLGGGALLEADLVYLPAVSIPDLVVRPRKGRLDLEVTLENRTWERFEGHLELRFVEPPFEPLASQEVALERGLLTTLAVRVAWRGGRIWTLLDPCLYEVEARLFNTGGQLDARRVRFGLSEALFARGAQGWSDEPPEPRRFDLADAPNPQAALRMMRQLKESGASVLRLDGPYPAFVLDCADQVGLLVESHHAGWAAVRLNDLAFASAAEDHLRRLARRDRNHPSLAAWYLDGLGADGQRLAGVLRAMDPTRPVIAGGIILYERGYQ